MSFAWEEDIRITQRHEENRVIFEAGIKFGASHVCDEGLLGQSRYALDIVAVTNQKLRQAIKQRIFSKTLADIRGLRDHVRTAMTALPVSRAEWAEVLDHINRMEKDIAE